MSDEPTTPDPDPAENIVPAAADPPIEAVDPPAQGAAPEAVAAPPVPQEPAPAMDVHHHTHHHGPKNWKTYVFEFFMLFLAVFCGFLAEWQLEHVVENQREEKFMRSMCNDLRADIDQATELMARLDGSLAGLDTLISIFADTAVINDSRHASRLWFRTAGFTDFVYTDGTMQQLKYSGALRLVRKAGVADSIMAYDRGVRTLLIHQEILNSTVIQQMDVFRLFDYRALTQHPDERVPLLHSTPAELSMAYSDRSLWRAQFGYLKQRLAWIKEHGTRLRAYIMEQYELED